MGPIETAVRAELNEDDSALALVAYQLASQLDLGAGGASAARELRFLMKELKPRKPFRGLGASRSPALDDGEQEFTDAEGRRYVLRDDGWHEEAPVLAREGPRSDF